MSAVEISLEALRIKYPLKKIEEEEEEAIQLELIGWFQAVQRKADEE